MDQFIATSKPCASCKDLRIRMQMMLDDMASGACCNDREYYDEQETNQFSQRIPSNYKKSTTDDFNSLLGIDV